MNKVISAIAAIAILASCAKTEDSTTDNWDGELRISSGISTRASGTTWEENDAIGVFMSTTGTETAVGAHNTKYTTLSTSSTAEFSVHSDFTDLYYPQSGNVDIVAHYPYSESAALTTYSVDVSDQSDLTAIDFMSAKMVGVAKSKTALALTFYHLLSQLKVTLTPAEDGGLTAAELASATIKVSGIQVAATATVDYDTTNEVPTATYSLSGDATALSLTASSSEATFIVVPQTADVTFTITVAGYGDFYATASGATFTSGDEHAYTISVSRTAVKIEGATINPWGTGESESLDADDYVETTFN
ncbi:MAG: fimbrillin family protein [Rikenellaceae bacterium]